MFRGLKDSNQNKKMKKTYIVPEALAVSVNTRLMMAQSLRYTDDDMDNDDALVKEIDGGNTVTHHSLWDDEW